MTKKQKIYIAGPMRGLPAFNYPAFNDWAKLHRDVGWDVVNPAEIGAQFGTPEQHALETCDAVFLMSGWQNSLGARQELATALHYGLKINIAPNVEIPIVRADP